MARTQTLVTAGAWAISTSIPSPLFSTPGIYSDEELRTVTLSVTRHDGPKTDEDPFGIIDHPEHHGRKFTGRTLDEARDKCDAYCLDHGLLKVYERSA